MTKRPSWSILTGRYYVPAHATDVRKTFERIRGQQATERAEYENWMQYMEQQFAANEPVEEM